MTKENADLLGLKKTLKKIKKVIKKYCILNSMCYNSKRSQPNTKQFKNVSKSF